MIINYSHPLFGCVSLTAVALMLFPTSAVNSASSTEVTELSSNCITYDTEVNIITITCKHVNLTNIDNEIRNPDILHKESTDGVWLLNAGIVIEQGASLYINSTDTSWLKIVAPRDTETTVTGEDEYGEESHIAKANGIEVLGSLKIDSIKMTSWDVSTNSYALNEGKRNLRGTEYEVQLGSPRPFISVEGGATGTTDITNSEIAFLGYEGGVGGGPVVGLTYFGGDGSIVKNNNIHHLYFAFYSNGVGNITIENNHIHHSGHYGLDPHTGTHDLIIRNNTVNDNGSIGIICSLDCYNIVIEDNIVYNNTKMGIMFSRNMFDSVARNNIVSGEEQGIVISESHNNEIYNNTVSDSGHGIDIDKASYENIISDNIIKNIPDIFDAFFIEEGAAEQNNLYSNKLVNTYGQEIDLDEKRIE
ncbi:MAG: NosD domain-containing protein [Nitrososphaeraceae archaeon]